MNMKKMQIAELGWTEVDMGFALAGRFTGGTRRWLETRYGYLYGYSTDRSGRLNGNSLISKVWPRVSHDYVFTGQLGLQSKFVC